MRAFITQRIGGSEELRAKLEWVESNLVAVQKAIADGVKVVKLVERERETARVEVDQLREKGKVAQAKCKVVEHENNLLKKELEKLRVGLAAQKKEQEGEYKKQVDEMFFYGYRCCMKKNGITQDTPTYPSNDQDVAPDSSSQGDGILPIADSFVKP